MLEFKIILWRVGPGRGVVNGMIVRVCAGCCRRSVLAGGSKTTDNKRNKLDLMLRALAMRTVVGLAAVTVMKCPTVAAFVRPTAIRSSLRHPVSRHVHASSSVSYNSTYDQQALHGSVYISDYARFNTYVFVFLLKKNVRF